MQSEFPQYRLWLEQKGNARLAAYLQQVNSDRTVATIALRLQMDREL